jgi:hypothetical protein
LDRPRHQERHDLNTSSTSVSGRVQPRADGAVPSGLGLRRPWWVWAAPFAVVLGVLLVRNAFLFSTPQYEVADMGANSILIEQARRFTLLVGHYSRFKFNHPGPAFLYVQSWGESLFWALLHVVPAAWNGQLIAVYVLNAVFAALVVAIGYGWTRAASGALATAAVVLCFAAVHPAIFSSDWMPYVLVPAYFAFVVAIASVTAGRGQDAWIAALTGWFLIHGYASFLFFVPVICLVALLALAWPRRRRLGTWVRSLARQPRIWVPVVAISAVFALPIALELALHWPGNFGKYLSYSTTAGTGAAKPTATQAARYALWFWWPHAHAWLPALVLSVVAVLLTWRLPAGPVRRFCVSLLAFDALSTLLFLFYAKTAVGDLTQYFAGYFYWSAPAIVLLVIVLGALEAARSARGVPSWPGIAAAAVAALVACAAFAVAPQTRTSTNHVDPNQLATGSDTDPALPVGVARVAAVSGGRPIVLQFPHDAWPEVTGFLVQAERTGVRACVANPYWEFMVTRQFICTPAELANGDTFDLYVPGSVPRGAPVVFRLGRAIVTSAAK